ncbi:MAG: hypothetical protein FI687_00785 [SAR202 cluster bacterium]|nr:hypothetical protein [SAR202 cluster bacterium]
MINLRVNHAKRKLENGGVVSCVGGYMNSDLAELFGTTDFDCIWMEAEHGLIDFGDIPDITRACDLWNKNSIIRINHNEPGLIYRVLDLGAQGVVVPHVNTFEQANQVVQAAKFHPKGNRGIYTSRQGLGVKNYFDNANNETMVIVLIEDIIAIENLDEILKVDEIDVFFVAPGDLAQTMGYLGEPNHSEVQAVVSDTLKKIRASGRNPGTLVTLENVKNYLDLGVNFVVHMWSPSWIVDKSKDFLNKLNLG